MEAPAHRYSRGYLTHERWISYVHQVSALADIAPCSVVEIGIGAAVKAAMIAATYPGCDYVGVDMEPSLNPEICADVRALPFADAIFDAAFCCQVLEHIPYSDFARGLAELKRVCRRRVVISLPDVSPFTYLRARPPASRWILPWLWRGISLPSLVPRRHEFAVHGQHHWEIGKRDYPARRILRDIRAIGWTRVRHFRMIERSYWHFYVLDV